VTKTNFSHKNSPENNYPLFPDPTLTLEMTIFSLLLLLLLLAVLPISLSKTTIEPCFGSDSCPPLLGYTLYTDLKVSEIAALFRTDPYAILATNAFDLTLPDGAHRILPARLFIRLPTVCACSDGTRKSALTRYTTRPTDTLTSIASNVFSGLASADQIHQVIII
jgi:hypothetical protein